MMMGLNIGVLLITLGMGYGILCIARKEGKFLKALGNIIGVIVLVLSVLLLAKELLWAGKMCKMMKDKQHHMGMMQMQGKPPMPEEPIEEDILLP